MPRLPASSRVKAPLRILIADDHEIIRFGLRQALLHVADLRVVAEAGRGDVICELLEQHHPDVLVLNIRMPGLNGIEVVQRIRALKWSVKILILTSRDNEESLAGALQAGADGYLLKTATLAEIVQAIRDVAAGQPALSPEIAQRWENSPAQASPSDLFSPRELEVLALAGKGYTNKIIAERLKISDRTVQTHLTRIYQKLQVTSRTEAVMRAISSGWIAPPDIYQIRGGEAG